jgi:hypothetical protein
LGLTCLTLTDFAPGNKTLGENLGFITSSIVSPFAIAVALRRYRNRLFSDKVYLFQTLPQPPNAVAQVLAHDYQEVIGCKPASISLHLALVPAPFY